MQQLIRTIKQKLANYERQISQIEAKLAKTEPSVLEVKLIHGKKRFVKYCPSDNKIEYLGKSKLDTIKTLFQKYYDANILKVLKKRQLVCKKCLKYLETPNMMLTLDNVYDTLPAEIKQFVKPNVITHEGYIRNWQNAKYDGLNFPFEGDFYTAKGERVRSKSEVIIADRLNLAGVPYHYEYPAKLTYTTLYPDFHVLNTRTLKTYGWEHFGLLDKTDYATKAKDKLMAYARDNIFPGTSLIVTFETSTCALDIQYVDMLIKKFLK